MGKVKKYEDVELPLQQGQGKELPFKPTGSNQNIDAEFAMAVSGISEDLLGKSNHVNRENDSVIELLKLIRGHLKAIENNTFKGY